MRELKRRGRALLCASVCALAPLAAAAQSTKEPDALIAALKGLAPVGTLPNTPEGQAALAANRHVTGALQTGLAQAPTLLPFHEQQQLALRDCLITDGNAAGLADGLGTRLGEAYRAEAKVGPDESFTSVAPSVADLIGYTNDVTKSDSNAGKFFFANATKDGRMPVSAEALAILTARGGTTDVFGKAYDLPAGSPDGDRFGNARPFQTAPFLLAYRGEDYFGRPSRTLDWLQGPSQTLVDSPAFPSGHTTYGYTESLVLALLMPERYQQMIARAAEYGHSRILVGAHYAMDVIGGRTVALHALAHLLANDPAYVGRARPNPAKVDAMGRDAGERVVIKDYPAALKAARADLTAVLTGRCGDAIAVCAASDAGRFKDARANEATQTYGLPVVHPERAGRAVDVGREAKEAGYLLTAAFPSLTLDEANAILTETLGPGGGFLDDGSAFGLYSRLDLYAASGKAAALDAGRRNATRSER